MYRPTKFCVVSPFNGVGMEAFRLSDHAGYLRPRERRRRSGMATSRPALERRRQYPLLDQTQAVLGSQPHLARRGRSTRYAWRHGRDVRRHPGGGHQPRLVDGSRPSQTVPYARGRGRARARVNKCASPHRCIIPGPPIGAPMGCCMEEPCEMGRSPPCCPRRACASAIWFCIGGALTGCIPAAIPPWFIAGGAIPPPGGGAPPGAGGGAIAPPVLPTCWPKGLAAGGWGAPC
jgi:hypothetical protein